MSRPGGKSLKRSLRRAWVFSPERLWRLSIRLADGGHWMIAGAIKQLNWMIYKNSLSPGASVAPDITLGHNSMGIVVHSNVTIGHEVTIWQNVTLTAGRRRRRPDGDGAGRASERPRSRIVVEDGVRIGANAVIIAPRGKTLRIGREARIGAGTVVTADVPAGGRLVGPPARLLDVEPEATAELADRRQAELGEIEHGG